MGDGYTQLPFLNKTETESSASVKCATGRNVQPVESVN